MKLFLFVIIYKKSQVLVVRCKSMVPCVLVEIWCLYQTLTYTTLLFVTL